VVVLRIDVPVELREVLADKDALACHRTDLRRKRRRALRGQSPEGRPRRGPRGGREERARHHEPFQTRSAKAVHQAGATPLAQMDPGNLAVANIANGSEDHYLVPYAFSHLALINAVMHLIREDERVGVTSIAASSLDLVE
jgi:hypothetical protein